AVQDDHRIRRAALRIGLWGAERNVVKPKLWQCFAGAELEVRDREVADLRVVSARLSRNGTRQSQHDSCKKSPTQPSWLASCTAAAAPSRVGIRQSVGFCHAVHAP